MTYKDRVRFEYSLRFLILMSCTEKSMTFGKLKALCFMSLNPESFNISGIQIEGKNRYTYMEYTANQNLMLESMLDLVCRGLADYVNKKGSVEFFITGKGKEKAGAFSSQLAEEFKENVISILRDYCDHGDRELDLLIADRSIKRCER